MDLTFLTTQNFFSRVTSFRYLTARRVQAFGNYVFHLFSFFSHPNFGLRMAYGVVWDWFLVMGNTIGWVRVFGDVSAQVAALDLSRFVKFLGFLLMSGYLLSRWA